MLLQGLKEQIKNINIAEPFGEVTDLKGGLLWVRGLSDTVSIGSLCQLTNREGVDVPCEVVAFEGDRTLLMGYKPLEGVGPGCPVRFTGQDPFLYPSDAWLGRIINGFGEPVDHKAPLPFGGQSFPLMAMPIPAHNRGSVGSRMDLGVRAMNSFTTCCAGQRLGIFAGSGVGKSVLLSQLAKYANADVIVIGLIGERGREVKEFIEEYLGPEGLERAVLVVATSDETALMRRRAAYATMTVAEYFRAQGKSVLCLMDSLTRFAMALREIGLAVGESPTTKGYTPNVFAELPRLLERSGPGLDIKGEPCAQMTGLFTVLVEGDDHNEPVADTVRGIIDGHIVLERKIAERGRFPAINILRSISRMMPQCNQQYETDLVNQARKYLSTYEDMEELIRLGAYRKGSNPEVDKAIFYYQKIEAFLSQEMGECVSIEEGFGELERILNTPAVATA